VLTLPSVPRESIAPRVIEWGGLPRRYMHPGELETLVSLVDSVRPSVMIEFGVNVGRTARAILDNVASLQRYQGIDVLPSYVPSKVVQRTEVPLDPGRLAKGDRRFELIVRARGSLDLEAMDLAPCEAVFIDGDHGRQAVLHDTELALALTRPGGIIVWHDYHDLGTVDVRDVLHELAGGGLSITHVAGTWLAFHRVGGAA